MGARLTPHVVKQVRYLLLNKELTYTEIERIIGYKTSWTSIRKIARGELYPEYQGIEPPDDYDEYVRQYVKM